MPRSTPPTTAELVARAGLPYMALDDCRDVAGNALCVLRLSDEPLRPVDVFRAYLRTIVTGRGVRCGGIDEAAAAMAAEWDRQVAVERGAAQEGEAAA